jgi:hypothetical protein
LSVVLKLHQSRTIPLLASMSAAVTLAPPFEHHRLLTHQTLPVYKTLKFTPEVEVGVAFKKPNVLV